MVKTYNKLLFLPINLKLTNISWYERCKNMMHKKFWTQIHVLQSGSISINTRTNATHFPSKDIISSLSLNIILSICAHWVALVRMVASMDSQSLAIAILYKKMRY